MSRTALFCGSTLLLLIGACVHHVAAFSPTISTNVDLRKFQRRLQMQRQQDNAREATTTRGTEGVRGEQVPTFSVNSPISRRAAVAAALLGTTVATRTSVANAAVDCMADCFKNCKLIAPKDPAYCKQTCDDYCAQEDRQDGLSGSVSSERGEVGILGINTVVKGEDKPPSFKLPGLDFTTEKGKKLIGY